MFCAAVPNLWNEEEVTSFLPHCVCLVYLICHIFSIGIHPSYGYVHMAQSSADRYPG